jgi:cell division protein FtsZ
MQKVDEKDLRPRLSVIGVGGAGGNAVNNMIRSGLEGVEFIVCNTDAQALAQSLTETQIQLGLKVTQGLGAGSRPDVGRAAAEESLDEVMSYLKNTNMLFITAGMGGGTGTGGAPVIAKAAREAGILTVGVVTKPFQFEGAHRTRSAERGIEEMHQCVDTLLVIPNQNLFRLANEHTTFADAFAMADDVLYSGVRTFTDLMIKHGLINLDFADICAVMREMMGKAMMGTGQASGERRAIEAAEHAISCPLLDNDVSMRGARAVLINISGGLDMTLFEVDEAANRIREEVDPNANIIFGATFDESISGHLRVSVVATGIDAKDLLAGAASEGSFKTTPRSVFRLGGQRLGEDLLEDTPGPQESLVSEEFVAPEAPPEELKKNHEKPFGRRHDLFSMDYEMASSRAQRGESFDESFEEQEGPYPLEMEEEDLEKLYPQSAKKSTAMTFLERLGVSRRNPPPPVAPEKKASPVSSRKKPDVLDLSSEGPTDLLDRDSLEIPAFMRNKRKNY